MVISVRWKILFLIVVVFVKSFTSAQAVEEKFLIPAFGLEERLDAFIATYEQFSAFNGTLLVAEKGKIVFEKSYGMSNYEFNIPNTPETKFRIASISKTITDAAIGILIDKKQLALESTIDLFYPDFPSADKITIFQLINHRAGIVHTSLASWYDPNLRVSLDELITLLANEPLYFEPGTFRRYSSGGYALLAGIIEKISGMSYAKFLQKELFIPLKMNQSGNVDYIYQTIDNLSQGYLPGRSSGKRSLSLLYNMPIILGGGSLYSSAQDLYKFIRPAVRRELISPELSNIIFDLEKDFNQGSITGWGQGYFSQIFYDTENDVYIISLSNNHSFPANWVRNILKVAKGEKTDYPAIYPSDKRLKIEESKYYSGKYEWQEPLDGPIKIKLHSGNLLFEDVEANWEVAMVHMRDGRFYNPIFDHICEFNGIEYAENIYCYHRTNINDEPLKLRRTFK